MEAYKGFVKAHSSIYLLLEYLRCRFQQKEMDYKLKNEWEKYKDKYVIDLE